MSNIVIVTKQCYLLCEAINYISVREIYDEDEKREIGVILPKKTRAKRRKSAKQILMEKLEKEAQLYEITIDFVPNPASQVSGSMRTSSHGSAELCIAVRGYDRALSLFKEMVGQIREQMPDKLFLDKLVERFFQEGRNDQ